MKKSLVVIALVVAALCSLFVFSVSAAEQENIHISSTEFQVRQGSEFTTTIYIADNANIIDFEVLLKYDTEKLTLISATENEDIKGAVVINAGTPGSIGINYSRTSDNVNKQTMLVDLTFRVDEYLPAGVYDCLTVDTSGSYVAHRLVNGLLEEVDFNCEFAPLSIYEIGDVDLNNKVDIGDATYIRRHLAKLHTLTDFQLLFANAQNDGLVDIADAVALQRNLAKLEVDNYGDRVNILFCNTDGEVLTKKSVQIGANLNTIPDVPLLSGYTNGRWSLSKTEYVAPDYTNLTSELTVYAIYEKSISPYMQYYMTQVNNIVNQYNGVITSDWTLPVNVVYASNTAYTATIDWVSSDANVFSNTGAFNEQTYDKTITLTAKIYSYLDSTTPESSETLTFTLLAKGAYSTPTKSEIVNYLKNVTNGTLSGTSTISGGEIDCDLNLIRKISNEQVGSTSGSVYEVRIEWAINNNGVYEPISQIKRGTSAKTIDLVATITFNGEPLEDDGKVYFDDVSLTAITEDEIRRYVIGEIASKVENAFSNGDTLWADEDTYGCEIKWISNDINTVTIEQNAVIVNEQAINGTTCPITVQVTYPTDSGSNTFNLGYVITVLNPNNTLLKPNVNISDSLYHALLIEMRDRFGYTQLTTEALKNTKFVSLDLSKYSDWFEDGAGDLHAPITDLTGLAYCENLRLLNISGLSISKGLFEISNLTNLESFIASNVDISSEAVSGTPVLSNMTNLKLVDLSNNELVSLEMFFSSADTYGKLKELYLDNNKLSDISLLSQTPMLTLLTLSNNNIDSDDIAVLADKVYLTYLSLNNNNISSISSLNKLTALTELRLHCNSISDVSPLKNITEIVYLYLGDNEITNISQLNKLTKLSTLYLNNNTNLDNVDVVSEMTQLKVLNVSGNNIDNLNAVASLTELTELYAENNSISSFAFVQNLTNLNKLLLANNRDTGDESENMSDYLSKLSNLTVLTLSGKKINSLDFLQTVDENNETSIKPIVRLEIADCSLPSYYVTSESDGTVTGYIDNIYLLATLKQTLLYLDISGNGLSYNIDGLTFAGDTPATINKLRDLSNLQLLYADNTDIGNNAASLMSMMSRVKYLSLEHCNITDVAWLAKSSYYIYVDVANNPISTFNFSHVARSLESLKYLYLDSTSTNSTYVCEEPSEYNDNILVALSLKNIGIADMSKLPALDNVKYLDVSQEYVDIFTKANLELMKTTYGDITIHLYSENQLPKGYINTEGFDAQREAQRIIDIREENAADGDKFQSYYSNVVEFRNKQNGYELDSKLNGYDVVWSMDTNNEYFSIEGNKLYVHNIVLPVEADEDYIFDLNIDLSLYGEAVSVSTIAKFHKEKYDIKYNLLTQNADYAQNVSIDNKGNITQYTPGDEIIINNPSRGAYDIFQGWYEDAAFTIPFVNDLEENPRSVTLYAKWNLVIYYNTLEGTPQIRAIGDRTRVVVDWSGYSAGTYDYSAAIDPDGDGVRNEGGNLNIDISNNITEIYFIGNPQATFTGVSLVPCLFNNGQDLNLKFKDFKFKGTSNAIWGYECGNFDLNMEFLGENAISSSSGSAICQFTNVNITGSGNLTVSGANGSNGGEYATGGSGQVAISVDYLTINTSGTMNVTGGNGGNGGNTSSNTSRANSLRTAGSGGNGADAISCVSCTISGNVTIKAGNGGSGGYGYKTKNNAGIGGDGGNGGHGIRYSETYSVSENVTSSGGSAGSGGGAQKWNVWGGDQQPGDDGSSGSAYYKS